MSLKSYFVKRLYAVQTTLIMMMTVKIYMQGLTLGFQDFNLTLTMIYNLS